MKIVLVVSSGGSIMNECLRNAFFKSVVHSVVSDRHCAGIEKARHHGLSTVVFDEPSKARFCNALLGYLKSNHIDYVISFYTKLFVGSLVSEYRDRILNLHPALLPSFKGLHGFEDTIRYGVTYLGSTIHFIDQRMDEGKIIIQTIYPIDRSIPEHSLRHKVFEQECKSLLQVVRWLIDGRISTGNGNVVHIEDAKFELSEYSPNLDWAEAISFEVPEPTVLNSDGT